MRTSHPIPITIISGFLGAGKTTLLNDLLLQDHGFRIAVLVNDFGAINIDASLIETVDDQVVSLSNGCICCSIRDDLLSTVWRLLASSDPPAYIVIEASGIADPGAIAFTFAAAGRHDSVRLDAVITVVDAGQVIDQRDEGINSLMNAQLEVADLVVINKVDLVDVETLSNKKIWVEERAKRAKLIEAKFGKIPAQLLLDLNAFKKSRDTHKPGKQPPFQTWSYETDRAVASLAHITAALRTLPEGIVRVKGILVLQDLSDKPVIVHRVGQRTDVQPGRTWAAEPKTQIVAIGLPGSLDGALMNRWFEQILVDRN